MSSVARWRRCWRAAPRSRRSEGLERDGLRRPRQHPRLRHPPRRAADLRLPRRPVVGALGRRRHRPRGQDPRRRLRRGGGRDLHRQRLARPRRGDPGDDRRVARPRLRVDRPARQPDRLRHRDQHGRRRHHRADRQRDLVAGRPHAAIAGHGAVQRDQAAVRRRARARAVPRPDLQAPDFRPRPHHLFRLRAACR